MSVDVTDVHAWVIDVDGCLVRTARAGGAGGQAIGGAVELIAHLRSRGDRFIVCTNASERPPAEYAQHLRALGLAIEDDQFVTAGSAAADYVAHHFPQAGVLVVGGDGLRAPFQGQRLLAAGDGLADVVVVGGAPSYTAEEINAACLAVQAGAPLFTTVDVPWFHGGRGQAVSISSAIAHAIGWVTATPPTVLGKPSPFLGETLTRRLGSDPAATAVVGDATIEVELARHMRACAILVLSGATGTDDLPTLTNNHTPDLVFTDVGELFQSLTGGIT